MHTRTCPSCSGPGNPANFGGTCDPCRTELNTRNAHTIDLRTTEAEQAAARREVYAR